MALNVQPEGTDCTSGDIQGQSKEQLRALNSYVEGLVRSWGASGRRGAWSRLRKMKQNWAGEKVR